MTRPLLRVGHSIWVACLLLSMNLQAASSFNGFATPRDFSRELRRLASDAATPPVASLPAVWTVFANHDQFRIPTAPLRSLSPQQQKQWLEYLADEIDARSPLPSSASAAHTQIDEILRDSKFSVPEARKSLNDTLVERIGAWLVKQINKLFRIAMQHPTTSQFLFWITLCGGIAFVAWRLFLLWDRRDSFPLPLAENQLAPPAQNEQQWIAAARIAAAAGDFSRAIQCAYWAAVLRLQDAGVLPAHSNQTPREFLRSLAPSDLLTHLQALTVALELFWYARVPARPENFAACLGSLEALGCNLG